MLSSIDPLPRGRTKDLIADLERELMELEAISAGNEEVGEYFNELLLAQISRMRVLRRAYADRSLVQ